MPTSAQDVAKYLEFSLLQLGTESYLHAIADRASRADVVDAWKFGFNDASHKILGSELNSRATVHSTP